MRTACFCASIYPILSHLGIIVGTNHRDPGEEAAIAVGDDEEEEEEGEGEEEEAPAPTAEAGPSGGAAGQDEEGEEGDDGDEEVADAQARPLGGRQRPEPVTNEELLKRRR